jgi:peptide/nickel transport system substrate-binding protein
MKKQLAFSLLMVFVLVGTLVFSACTPSSPSPSTTATPSSSASPSQTSAPKPSGTTTAATGPIRGGTLRLNILSEPPAFDPYSSNTHRILALSSAVFSGLVQADPLKKEVSVDNLIPDLAEKWSVSSDGKTYTFNLRQGVKFHDGKPFSATDAKYSLDRYRDTKSSVYAGSVACIDNVQIVDDYTVKVNLKYAYSDFPLFILPPYFAVLPAHLKDVNTKSTDFMTGTGPFKYKSSTAGKQYEFVRNPDYFIKGLPYLDAYTVYVIPTPQFGDQFVGGRLDVAGTLRQVLEDKPVIDNVVKNAPEARISNAPNGATRGMIFNIKKTGPWQDARVRKAMAMVLDYDGTIVAAVGGFQSGFVAPAGVVPYAVKEAMSKDEVTKALGLDKPLDQRIATAKQLMKDAGVENGFSATALTDETPVRLNPVLFAADLWKRYLNIDVKTESVQSAMYITKEQQRQFDMAFGFFAPSTGVSVVESLAFFASDAATNNGGWANKDYDALFQQISRETDAAKKKDLALQAQKIFFDQLPYLPFHATTYGNGVRPDLMLGNPGVLAPVLQTGQTSLMAIGQIWFAGTPNAERWIKTQP